MMRRIASVFCLFLALCSGAAAQTGRVLSPTQMANEIGSFYTNAFPGSDQYTIRQTLADIVATSSLTGLQTNAPAGSFPVFPGNGGPATAGNSISVLGIGAAVSPYSPLFILGMAATPSSLATGLSAIEFRDAAGVALAMGTYDSAPYPAWIQTRDLNFNNPLPLLLNPVKGGVVIGSTTAAPGITSGNGLQIGAYWANTSTYVPPGGATITASLLVNSVASGYGGVQSFTRTSTTAGTAQGFSSYAFADSSSTLGAWPFYSEGHRLTANGYAYGLGEASVVNRYSTVIEINPSNVPTIGGTVGFQLETGNGTPISDYTEYSASVGLIVQSNYDASQTNAHGFAHGIVFRQNALDSTLFSPPDAIALAGNSYEQAISWWSSGSNRSWLIYSDAASGNNTLELGASQAVFSSAVNSAGYTVGATAGVDCVSGVTAATVTVSKGIVTHC
jgi:hypothetical protein